MSDEASEVNEETVEAVEPTEETTAATDSAEQDPEAGGESAASDEDAKESTKAEIDLDALDNEADIAADYLEDFLDIIEMDGDIDTYIEGDRPHVSVLTTSQKLVGKEGEILESLQELARLAVLTETGTRSRLMLDIAGYRENRRKELQLLAKDAVAEVIESGEPVRLQPMNPFERKIVHDVVAAAGLVSESEGVEPDRRVVIEPKA
jgi:spoIIIJ-associated protein